VKQLKFYLGEDFCLPLQWHHRFVKIPKIFEFFTESLHFFRREPAGSRFCVCRQGMPQALIVSITGVTYINGDNGVNNLINLKLVKTDLGQKVSQLTLPPDSGYNGLIEGSFQYIG